MPPGQRPKQRQLIRWNVDEVARRMGSGFTEGAIQQHIAKLRKQMAGLNNVPVPPPPKRGNITTRPSAVYGRQSRAVVAPRSQSYVQKSASRTIGGEAQTAHTEQNQAMPKARGRRAAAQIKRSDSDYADSDEEFAGASDGEYEEQPIKECNKRKRRVAIRNRSNPTRMVSMSQEEAQSKTISIMQSLAAADEHFEAQHRDDASTQNPYLQPIYSQAFPTVVPRQPGFGANAGHANTAHVGDEEEEEEVPASEQAQGGYHMIGQQPVPPATEDEQINLHHTYVTPPFNIAPFSRFNSQGNGEFGAFQNFGQPPPLQSNFSSMHFDNPDYSGFNSFTQSKPASNYSSLPPSTALMGPSTFPNAVWSNGPEHNLSSPSARHASLMSQTSSLVSVSQPPQDLPQHNHGQDGGCGNHESPQRAWDSAATLDSTLSSASNLFDEESNSANAAAGLFGCHDWYKDGIFPQEVPNGDDFFSAALKS